MDSTYSYIQLVHYYRFVFAGHRSSLFSHKRLIAFPDGVRIRMTMGCTLLVNLHPVRHVQHVTMDLVPEGVYCILNLLLCQFTNEVSQFNYVDQISQNVS